MINLQNYTPEQKALIKDIEDLFILSEVKLQDFLIALNFVRLKYEKIEVKE